MPLRSLSGTLRVESVPCSPLAVESLVWSGFWGWANDCTQAGRVLVTRGLLQVHLSLRDPDGGDEVVMDVPEIKSIMPVRDHFGR
jgi:hypothetical protein